MRKSILVLLSVALMVGTFDISAQSLLKNLGRNLENAVKKEVNRAVSKGIRDLKDGIKDGVRESGQKLEQQRERKQAQKQQEQKQQAQKPQEQKQQAPVLVQTQKTPASKPTAKATDVLIPKMRTWLLVVKDGKPHYKCIDDSSILNENYILYDVKYEHPDGVKPFMFTTAVATFKAKDGFYFNKSLKLDDTSFSAENTVKFKVVDCYTVKVYLTAFTGDMGYDVRITDAMKEYRQKISQLKLFPVATAKINAPLWDYWQSRLHGAVTQAMVNFVNKHKRTYYAYPTTEELRCMDGTLTNDGKKKQFESNITIQSVDILDLDLSDDIPGLVGEWCLIADKKFIPKACLKGIKSGSQYSEGAPAVLVDSPFQFAGGSGTLEDPYLIQTAEQLNAVRKGPTFHYKLIADIDLSKWGNWVPIGCTAAYGFMERWDKAEKGAFSFSGSLDGDGHVISGMQIVINEPTPYLTEGTNFRAYGLFGSLATSPKKYQIKNLGVVNFNIDINYTNLKKEVNLYAAAICGGMNAGTDMYNCYSKGGKIRINVIGNEMFAAKDAYGNRVNRAPYIHIHAGGLCADGGGAFSVNSKRGEMDFLHIENCFNDSDVTVEVKDLDYVAYGSGIISAMGETHIHQCYNSGNITLPLELEDIFQLNVSTYAAGISAFASIRDIGGIHHYTTERTSFIQNCYNTGQIVGRSAAGIFNLSVSDIHLENCYNAGAVIGNEFDHSSDGCSMHPIVSKASAIVPYGKEFVRNCYSNGNSVAGTMWKTSTTLGRKVLAAIPEDTHPSNKYNVEPANVGTFTDVKVDEWYADAVQWAFNKGIVSGTTFSGNKSCTRAQFITMLWKADGSPKVSAANPFTDVKSTDAHYDAALWAKEKGLIVSTTFAPQTVLTRGEFVITLWKYLGCPEGLQANQYLDIESHQSDFGRAVAWSHLNSVMGATERNKFSPKKSIIKTDVVNIMYRALK